MSAVFEATRIGSCANPECGTGIVKVGERAHYVSMPEGVYDVIVHEVCPAEPPPPAVCSSCHMALPATGRCDDCD